jgi:hypothetical protein
MVERVDYFHYDAKSKEVSVLSFFQSTYTRDETAMRVPLHGYHYKSGAKECNIPGGKMFCVNEKEE